MRAIIQYENVTTAANLRQSTVLSIHIEDKAYGNREERRRCVGREDGEVKKKMKYMPGKRLCVSQHIMKCMGLKVSYNTWS